CGMMGAVSVPPLAAWLLYVGVKKWHAGGGVSSWVACGAAVGALFLVTFYFVDLRLPRSGSPGTLMILKNAWRYLTVAFGAVVPDFWWLWGLVVACSLFGAAVLVLRACQNSGERTRASGLAAFLIAQILVALAIGFGRPGHGLVLRYGLLAAPCL